MAAALLFIQKRNQAARSHRRGRPFNLAESAKHRQPNYLDGLPSNMFKPDSNDGFHLVASAIFRNAGFLAN
jgi:hypothetical protein